MKDTHHDAAHIEAIEPFGTRPRQSGDRGDAINRKREQAGYQMAMIASAFAGGFHTGNSEPRLVNWARNFCVIFAFVAPVLLVVRVGF